MGAGCKEERRGVAILLKACWSKNVKFVRVSERLCYADLCFGQQRARVISCYLPDSTYADKHVEDVYLALSIICEEARQDKRIIMIGGDFNAEPGKNNFAGWDDTLGRHGLERRNARGEWLATWAETHNLVIGNTHFKNDSDISTPTRGPLVANDKSTSY
jgi:exonuclease III